jgi:hypothetical protein
MSRRQESEWRGDLRFKQASLFILDALPVPGASGSWQKWGYAHFRRKSADDHHPLLGNPELENCFHPSLQTPIPAEDSCRRFLAFASFFSK